VYISKIIKDGLDEKEIVALSQAYRKLKEAFKDDSAMSKINAKITDEAKISDKNVSVSVDMSVKNSWETILMTYIENIPFQQIGKGEQCIIKTNLALSHKMALASNLILIEEPENHLSHSNLNILTNNINEKCSEKQLIITTHSNYIANKLRLDNIIFLSNKIVTYFSNIDKEDADYFYKLPGYDTLRLILSQSAILVEGPSDELIVQKAFFYKYNVLPIEKGVDVISVKGLSFKRFLSIAKMTTKKVAVITDNDGDYNKNILEKYAPFNECPNIKICADNRNEIKTLEPQFVDANKEDLKKLRTLLNIEETRYPNSESISKYMQQNKTDWALFVFDAGEHYNIPQYINDAIDFVYGK
jgi:putative ATP-dependent endonuclease of OLD family